MMSSSFASSYSYNIPVYLTNMTASTAGDGSTIASFGIGGGTNFVPWDILMSTNLANDYSQWTFIGIGYTSNNYTFYGQPSDVAFYILAKPSKTMTVGWGDDTYGQCDVPSGITNALMVAGGYGQSLALLNDGTVMAWGDNTYGQGSGPTNLIGVAMIAAGWNHDVALLTNGTVVAWGANSAGQTNVPPDLTNAIVISAQAMNTLALRSDGTVVAWGPNLFGQTNVPFGLTNVTAIAAGVEHSLAVSNGMVVAWGGNDYGQANVPVGLSNVVDVAASGYHSLALLINGTVMAWGDNTFGETNVPGTLTNVVAIAAGGRLFFGGPALPYSLALKSDGTVVAWGAGDVLDPLGGLSNVIFIGGGVNHALAVRTGPPTPVITLEPTDQYYIAGGNVTFTARGAGLYGVTYQWETNSVNITGATNATLSLTNVQSAQEAVYNVLVSNEVSNILSTNANLSVLTPPVITSQTLPTNQVVIYGNLLSFAVTATAPGQLDGFPLTYQWQFNGTNISGPTTSNYNFNASDNSSGIYSVIVSNAAGSTNVVWQVTVTNVIDVTKDLLLIYNTNSLDSSNVWYYYMQHRPMISNANVLGIGCVTNEITTTADFTNQIRNPVVTWLNANPTKRPQYVILFLDISSRINDGGPSPSSVSYNLSTNVSGWSPFITHINMNGTNDCRAYIDKLEFIGTNYSPGKLIISASAGAYGNTNYVLDGIRHGTGYVGGENFSGDGYVVSSATNGLLASGVSANAILFSDGLEIISNSVAYNLPHPTGTTNVAGYICWGAHSSLGAAYATNGAVQWHGNSGWWIIETVESFNGQRVDPGQGTFMKWCSPNAFGGTNYSNTPVGAVTYVEEPKLAGVNDSTKYFGLWAAGRNFAICAWNSRNTPYFQAVGDPLIIR